MSFVDFFMWVWICTCILGALALGIMLLAGIAKLADDRLVRKRAAELKELDPEARLALIKSTPGLAEYVAGKQFAHLTPDTRSATIRQIPDLAEFAAAHADSAR